ncbi:serine/threonine-protein phosphatase 6 regulatory subunit 3-like isoform X1 [Leptonychotes weddellii]|uniref:Serine/threonine-protein phosphatase 6 regulatory subunit 3-like isoform X1 n=1 Tax=Leptonychotes weddellii TaxID=9713 RepID=A0A7F8RN65_LEPWE|nr:serine/threonine-protein phosphatase 6 regulatory subunit 3-like isoform X1 [Leptonychotes weddellii]
MEASSDGEEDAESTDKVTETVMNGGMKETLSLTVDAKTETAVFKRVLKSYREEGKLSTSQDAACKDVEESPETAEAKSAGPRPPSSSPEQSHLLLRLSQWSEGIGQAKASAAEGRRPGPYARPRR